MPSVPKPHSRLWRTFFKKPRDIRPFAEPIPFEAAAQIRPSLEEAAHWGEVMLLEDNVSVLHRDGTVSTASHYITLLHGDPYLAIWDQLTRYYDKGTNQPTVRQARLHFPDGRTRQAAVRHQSVSPDGQMRLLHIAFDQLRPGVILEWQDQDDWFIPNPAAPCVWGAFFQRTAAPCRWRRYTVAVAAPFAATLQLHHGATPPAESKVGAYHVYRWELRDQPGIEWDAWTPPLRDFAPWVDYSTLPTWEPIANLYHNDLRPRELAAMYEQARDLTRKAATAREKAARIYLYAVRQVRYGRPPQEYYVPASRPLSKIAEDLRGDCKDKSSLLVGLLGEAGINARIAVVNTRTQGEAPFLPSGRFDHALVVAELEGQEVWLDAAAGPYSFGDVPYGDQGVKALILDEKEHRYAEVPRPRPDHHTAHYACRGRLDEAGGYHVQATFTARGERAAHWRRFLLDRTEEFRVRQVIQAVAQYLPGAEVSDVRLTLVDDLEKELIFSYAVTLKDWARRIDRLLLLRVPWAEPSVCEGPLAAKDRPHPMRAPLVQGVTEEHDVELPPGYEGYGLPYERTVDCPWGHYEGSIRMEDGRLRCRRRLEVLGGIVPAERFGELKRFWEACARSDTADVVLMKGGDPPRATDH